MNKDYILFSLLIFINGCTSRTNFVEIPEKQYYYEYWIMLFIVFIFLFIIYEIIKRRI